MDKDFVLEQLKDLFHFRSTGHLPLKTYTSIGYFRKDIYVDWRIGSLAFTYLGSTISTEQEKADETAKLQFIFENHLHIVTTSVSSNNYSTNV